MKHHISRKRTLGRPPTRRSGIVEELRGRIIEGEWKPGAQIPTLRDLCKQYEADFSTMQQAVGQLGDEGFVEARRSRGVFVALSLPHRERYAILSTPVDEGTTANKFVLALNRAAGELQQEKVGQFEIWNTMHPQGEGESFERLTQELKENRIAGIILRGSYQLVSLYGPLAERHGVPIIALGFPLVENAEVRNIGYTWLDFRDFFRKGLDRLKEQGCRRVGCMTIPGVLPYLAQWGPEDLIRECESRGMHMPSYWVQHAAIWGEDYVRRHMQLWMSLPKDQRPDGLIIADDNIVEGATKGIIDAQVHVPQDLKIIAHSNFQSPARSVTPVTWLGFDEKELLLGAVEYLKAARDGAEHSGHTPIPAHFEEDWRLKNERTSRFPSP